ncbi:hypothetical protein OAD74_07080 [Alphaproteobacteria bacterium]|nr:hypothetical protein [Alphaproteobacteria bacterium]
MNDDVLRSVDFFKKLAVAPQISHEHVKIVSQILDNYFGTFERSRNFRGVETALSKRFGEMLSLLDREQGLTFTGRFFLFCYTLTLNYKAVQKSIFENIAIPFKKWAEKEWEFLGPSTAKIGRGKEYVFICRHAVTKGGYAPGSSIYTFAKALLNANNSVTVICLGSCNEDFINIEKIYPKFRLAVLEDTPPSARLLTIIELLKLLKPYVILTEVEFDVVSILSILRPNIPFIYLSPGYYNLPWFDKIGLTDNLIENPIGDRTDDFFEIPNYVSEEILNPSISNQQIYDLKSQLDIKESDFVLGSFARMEKFQAPFLEVLHKSLERSKNIKIILAGPNDRSFVEKYLNSFVQNRRAIILPSSDVHVLGNCIQLGIDTFPTHSGFSMLEIMAKGIPVVAKQDKEMDALWKQRLPDLMRKTDEDLTDLICQLSSDKELYKSFVVKTVSLMKSDSNDEKFILALENAIMSCSKLNN